MDHSTTHYREPMSEDLFGRWLWVWNVLFYGTLLLTNGIALWQTRGSWGVDTLLMLAAAVVTGVLHFVVLMRAERWPHPLWQLVLYYAALVGLWLLMLQVSDIFYWFGGVLIGQMFGVLPPVAAIPGVLTMAGLIALSVNNWQLPERIVPGMAAIIAAQIGFGILLYVYIYHLIQSSQQRGQLVEELEAAKAELLRAQAQQAELAALRERERVARGLHDGLGHSLVALSMQLEATQRLYRVDPERASAQIDAMKQLTRTSMAELRSAIEDLRAPALGEQPLSQAIGRLAGTISARSALAVTASVAPAADRLAPAVTETLWRVAQESLTNVERHAAASRVDASVRVSEDAVVLTLADDGRGLPDDAETRPGHYGLRGMRERVEGLGGVMTLSETAGGGTTVTVRLPLVGQFVPAS